MFNFLRDDGHRLQKTPKTVRFPKSLVPEFSLFKQSLGQALNQWLILLLCHHVEIGKGFPC